MPSGSRRWACVRYPGVYPRFRAKTYFVPRHSLDSIRRSHWLVHPMLLGKFGAGTFLTGHLILEQIDLNMERSDSKKYPRIYTHTEHGMNQPRGSAVTVQRMMGREKMVDSSSQLTPLFWVKSFSSCPFVIRWTASEERDDWFKARFAVEQIRRQP